MTVIHDIRSQTQRTNGTRKRSAIKNIARHHSATTSGDFFAFWKTWHGVKGWGTGGYHEIILRDGSVQLCYDPEEITNGVGGQNSYIYNICLVGNGSFTAAQEKTFEERVHYWLKQFGLPVSAVRGHNEFPGQNTTCPGINMNTVRNRLAGSHSGSSVVSDSGLWDVRFGEVNNRVGSVQKILQELGYYKGALDNSFGPAMEAAVKAFQKAQKLTADGIFGPGSQEAARKALAAKAAASKPKPKPKKKMFRVYEDGKQTGAYSEDDNVLAAARKAMASGVKNIKIEEIK